VATSTHRRIKYADSFNPEHFSFVAQCLNIPDERRIWFSVRGALNAPVCVQKCSPLMISEAEQRQEPVEGHLVSDFGMYPS